MSSRSPFAARSENHARVASLARLRSSSSSRRRPVPARARIPILAHRHPRARSRVIARRARPAVSSVRQRQIRRLSSDLSPSPARRVARFPHLLRRASRAARVRLRGIVPHRARRHLVPVDAHRAPRRRFRDLPPTIRARSTSPNSSVILPLRAASSPRRARASSRAGSTPTRRVRAAPRASAVASRRARGLLTRARRLYPRRACLRTYYTGI